MRPFCEIFFEKARQMDRQFVRGYAVHPIPPNLNPMDFMVTVYCDNPDYDYEIFDGQAYERENTDYINQRCAFKCYTCGDKAIWQTMEFGMIMEMFCNECKVRLVYTKGLDKFNVGR